MDECDRCYPSLSESRGEAPGCLRCSDNPYRRFGKWEKDLSGHEYFREENGHIWSQAIEWSGVVANKFENLDCPRFSLIHRDLLIERGK